MLHHLNQFIQRGLDNHLRLAVTGLSRSGKTAFITSVVDQLLHISANDNSHLPLFFPAQRGQIISVKRIEQGDLTVPRFEYDRNRQCFENENPSWPQSTTGISEIRLAIRHKNSGLFGQIKETGTLYLDIFDYPGEWLLDLPLLAQSFQQWSQHLSEIHYDKREDLAQNWQNKLAEINLADKADENKLAELSECYCDYLLECKKAGMHYIQPGRFVLSNEPKGAPVFQFFPLLNLSEEQWNNLEKTDKSSYFHTLKRRYTHYQQKIVKPFYENYFSLFDRQVILADCLTPLNHSHQAFLEMKLGLQQLFKHFHYGNRNLFHRLFSSNIDKLLFLATKADHITVDQIPNLESLMRQLVQEGGAYNHFGDIETGYRAIAAIKATEALNVVQDGVNYKAIRGVRESDGKLITLYPGEVPNRLPEVRYWQDHCFEFDQFLPQRLDFIDPIPHFRLDAVLQFLLADKFD